MASSLQKRDLHVTEMGLARNKILLPAESSPLIITFCLGLLLINLFITLGASREPSKIKKDQVLRSIAANFRRNSTKASSAGDKAKKIFKVETNVQGLMKLSVLINEFFLADGQIKPDATIGIRQLASTIAESNATIELYCGISASGASSLTALEKIDIAEGRCSRLGEILKQEGIPGFNISSRSGFSLNGDDQLKLIIRGEAFHASWN